jgi:hypothetical protein
MLAEEILSFLQKIVHEPGKIGKAVIAIAKAALCIIGAQWLYVKIIGPYQLIAFDSYSAWYNYIISGRILFSLFALAFTYFVLFQVLGWLTSLIFNGIQHITKLPDDFTKVDRTIIQYLFNKFRILAIDFENRKIRPAKRTEEFYQMLVVANSEEGKNEIATLKDSYASQIWHTYFVFVIYYFGIYSGPTNLLLSAIIIIGLAILTGFYFGASFLLNFLQHQPDRMLREFETIRLQAVTEKVFSELGFFTYQIVNENNTGFETLITINGKKYSVVYQFKRAKQLFTEHNLQVITDHITGTNKSVLLLTNLRLTERMQQLIAPFSDSLVILSFTDEKSLLKQLEEFLFTHA